MIGTMTQIVGIDGSKSRKQSLIGWGGRAEGASSVAARLFATLAAIEKIDNTPAGSWFDVNSLASLDLQDLESYVRQQAFRDEIGAIHPDHGYSFRVGRRATEAVPTLTLDINAGSGYGTKPGVWINSVQLAYLGDQEIARQYFSGVGCALLGSVIKAWSPDFGFAGAISQQLATAPKRYGVPGISAVTWLSDQFSIPEQVPGADVRDFEGGHTIFVGSAELADSSVEAAVGVHSYLLANGLGLAAANQPQF